VTDPGTQDSVVGQDIALPIQANGLPSGASWTFSATGLPSGLSINSSSGVISGTVTGVVHNYSVNVTADDGQGGSASRGFTWHVQAADTTTALVGPSGPSPFGQVVAFTATVTANTPSTATPTGIVSFFDNGILLGTSGLSGGVAGFSTGILSVGSHSIT